MRTLINTIIILFLFSSCTKDQTKTRDRWFFENDGAKMMVNVEGNFQSKVILLLLHGGPGGSGAEYNSGSYQKILEERYAMAYWDQRGQGASTGNYGQDKVTIVQMAKDCAALIKALKFKYGPDNKIFLLGHSWGGMLGTATLLETDAQQELAGWIDVDGAHDIPLLNTSAIDMMLEISAPRANNNDFWKEMLEFAQSIDTNNISISEGGIINSLGHQAEEHLPELTSDPMQYEESYFKYLFIDPTSPYTSSMTGTITSNQIFNEVETTSYTSQLKNITIPCLFQWGKFDFVVPPRVGQVAYQSVGTPTANKFYIEYPTSGHSPMSNEPQAFANDIIDFVELYK